MKFKIQVVTVSDDVREETREIASLERDDLQPETLGLTLAESKAILKDIQEIVVERQATDFLASQRCCPDCGRVRNLKGYHTLKLRTVFGKLEVKSPRLHHCDCRPQPTQTYSPLAELLPEHTTPELLFLETKWAALVSYGLTAKLLEDVLPMDEPLNAFTIRRHVFEIAERMENTLGEEQVSFIESCPRDQNSLPLPDGPLAVGIDGGFARGQRKEGNFEVIVGKSILSFRRDQKEEEQTGKCFAFVQTFDTKPKRRLFELLKSQGMQDNQQIVFLSDGGEDVRNPRLYLSPEAEHVLDWFHLSMRITVLKQTAKGLSIKVGEGDEERELRETALKLIESSKWYLWHGNVFQAIKQLEFLEMDMESANFESPSETTRKLLQAINEFHTYIDRNRAFIPNYGERYRNGERISTSFVESAVNQVMRGTEPVKEVSYLTDMFGDEAVAFIERRKDSPWFLYLAFNADHTPMHAKEQDLARFAHIKDPLRQKFAAMHAAMDNNFGRVLEALREHKLEENTLIFFVSDNGGPTNANASRNTPLRGFKAQTWEGGIRVPMLAQWKGALPVGKVYEQPVIQLDFLPTALAAAGAEIKAEWKLDGVNLLPHLTGQRKGAPHEALYWRFGQQIAVRMGDWKLVKAPGANATQVEFQTKATTEGAHLYHLAADIGEQNNLAEKEPARRTQLAAAWDKWNAELIEAKWIPRRAARNRRR